MDNLISWILTFGGKAEVIEPEEARKKLLEIAELIEKNYKR